MKQSVGGYYVQLIDGVVAFNLLLLIFCMLDLSIFDAGFLKFPNTIVDSFFSFCSSISFHLVSCDAVFSAYLLLINVVTVGNIHLSHFLYSAPANLFQRDILFAFIGFSLE